MEHEGVAEPCAVGPTGRTAPAGGEQAPQPFVEAPEPEEARGDNEMGEGPELAAQDAAQPGGPALLDFQPMIEAPQLNNPPPPGAPQAEAPNPNPPQEAEDAGRQEEAAADEPEDQEQRERPRLRQRPRFRDPCLEEHPYEMDRDEYLTEGELLYEEQEEQQQQQVRQKFMENLPWALIRGSEASLSVSFLAAPLLATSRILCHVDIHQVIADMHDLETILHL